MAVRLSDENMEGVTSKHCLARTYGGLEPCLN